MADSILLQQRGCWKQVAGTDRRCSLGVLDVSGGEFARTTQRRDIAWLGPPAEGKGLNELAIAGGMFSRLLERLLPVKKFVTKQELTDLLRRVRRGCGERARGVDRSTLHLAGSFCYCFSYEPGATA